jgi:hypothetical protein
MYKAGYDPQAFIDFFEKIQAKEKSRPGTVAKAFSTHPPTPDRIAASQEELRTILPPRPEYLVSTSEFAQVSERLRVLENRGQIEEARDQKGRPTLRKSTRQPPDTGTNDDGRPTLKRSTGANEPPSADQDGATTMDQGTSGGTADSQDGDDTKPTLKRR